MHRLTEKDEQGNWALKGVKWASLHGGAAARYKEVRKHPDAAEDGRPHYAALYRV